ncbi:uracil phosphoribosyltransferase [Rhodococcus hoagii]|nr:uracil phosphoribosyltransferase [Prescottella equi]
MAVTTGYRLAAPPLLVPVLRAGLGMVDQASLAIPQSRVGFVGMARDEETHQPGRTSSRCRPTFPASPVYVLDPMLATRRFDGAHDRSARRAWRHRRHRGVCGRRTRGVDALANSGHPVRLVTATVDEGLDENAFIVPGLGDAGDRQFGPR